MSEKTELRRRYLEARRAMAAEEAAAKSEKVVARLWEIPEFCNARIILSYVSSKDNEVETQPLIESLLAQGKTVLVPIAERSGRLSWSQIHSLDELAPSRLKIMEPAPEYRRDRDPADGAVVLVPGIVSSPECTRIGYGWGYFDRFLAQFQGLKIGLAYDLQIVPRFSPSPRDVPLDIVLTESTVYRRPQ